MEVRTRRRVLSFIRSPASTPYRVRDLATGESEWVRCAMDALLYPLLTGRTVEITARPPEVSEPLRLVVGPEGADAWPAVWVVTFPDWPGESGDFDRIARERCPSPIRRALRRGAEVCRRRCGFLRCLRPSPRPASGWRAGQRSDSRGV